VCRRWRELSSIGPAMYGDIVDALPGAIPPGNGRLANKPMNLRVPLPSARRSAGPRGSVARVPLPRVRLNLGVRTRRSLPGSLAGHHWPAPVKAAEQRWRGRLIRRCAASPTLPPSATGRQPGVKTALHTVAHGKTRVPEAGVPHPRPRFLETSGFLRGLGSFERQEPVGHFGRGRW
jgi:hypothetical protein